MITSKTAISILLTKLLAKSINQNVQNLLFGFHLLQKYLIDLLW